MRAPRDAAALPAPELGVGLDEDVLVREAGRLLAGGVPFRLIRLSEGGAHVVARWRAGGRVGASPGERALARRLLDAGMLVSAPVPAAPGDVAIVVPARDRRDGLARCLAALARRPAGTELVVVDDGSEDADGVRAVAEEHGARVVRRVAGGGPAAARNAGLAATSSPFVAFVDSDVVVEDGWLARLRGHFDDPAVGAAAPRVLGLVEAGSAITAHEARRSSLDMGARPGSARPGGPVPYVPATVLVVRREAVPGGGFAEALTVGEDVDFVWRMVAGGWRIAYDPSATVRHEHRVQPGAFARRRWEYARSIGPLARRHPGLLPAVRVEPFTAATLALAAAGRPRAAGATLLAGGLILRRRLEGHAERPAPLTAELAARGLAGTAAGLGHAVRRVWSPLLLAAAAAGHRRAALVLLAAVADAARRDSAYASRELPVALADDLIAALGTWAGCGAARTAGPLLPARAG